MIYMHIPDLHFVHMLLRKLLEFLELLTHKNSFEKNSISQPTHWHILNLFDENLKICKNSNKEK